MTPFGAITSYVCGNDFASVELRRELRDIVFRCQRVDDYPRTVGRHLQLFLGSGCLADLEATDRFIRALEFAERGFADIARGLQSARIGIEILNMDRLVGLRLAEDREKS